MNSGDQQNLNSLLDAGHKSTTGARGQGAEERRYAAMRRLSRDAVIPAAASDEFLRDAAVLLADALQLPVYLVARPVDGGKMLEIHTSGEAIDAETHRCPIAEHGSMPGFALARAAVVVSQDLVSDLRFLDLYLRGRGLISGIAVPLTSGGQPLGVIGVYAAEKREFTDADSHFCDVFGSLVTMSLVRAQLERELREQRELSAAVLDTSDSLLLVLDGQDRIINLNEAFSRCVGFKLEEIRGRTLWNTLATPEELERVRAVFRRARASQQRLEYECDVLAKSGQRYRIRWSQVVTHNPDGQVRSVVLIGTNLTPGEKPDAAGPQRGSKPTKDSSPEESNSAGPNTGSKQATAAGGASHRSGSKAAIAGGSSLPLGQSVAPLVDGSPPTPADFFPVEFRDVSAGGVTFLLDEKPDFNAVVLALGTSPKVVHVAARIVRVVPTEHDGRQTHLVVCRFVGRIEC